MDQTTARALAKLLSETTGNPHVALTDYHLKGEFDEPDATWVVIHVGTPGAPITEVPRELFTALAITSLGEAAASIRRMGPTRPQGEEDDRRTVTEIRKLLADYFLAVHDENLAMRSTISLVEILIRDAAGPR